MNISQKRKLLVSEHYLKGYAFKNTDCSTYLGVLIMKDHKWSDHVDRITFKANKTLGLTIRNTKIDNQDVKLRAFNTLICPVLNYVSSIWDPDLQKDIDNVQAVQNRYVRYVCNSRYHNTSSPTEMFTELDWQPLTTRLMNIKLCTFYKIHRGLVYITCLIILQTPSTNQSQEITQLSILQDLPIYQIPEWM